MSHHLFTKRVSLCALDPSAKGRPGIWGRFGELHFPRTIPLLAISIRCRPKKYTRRKTLSIFGLIAIRSRIFQVELRVNANLYVQNGDRLPHLRGFNKVTLFMQFEVFWTCVHLEGTFPTFPSKLSFPIAFIHENQLLGTQKTFPSMFRGFTLRRMIYSLIDCRSLQISINYLFELHFLNNFYGLRKVVGQTVNMRRVLRWLSPGFKICMLNSFLFNSL